MPIFIYLIVVLGCGCQEIRYNPSSSLLQAAFSSFSEFLSNFFALMRFDEESGISFADVAFQMFLSKYGSGPVRNVNDFYAS